MAPGKLVVARAPFLALVGSLFAAAAACDGALDTSSASSGSSSGSGAEPDASGASPDAARRPDATAGDAGRCEDDDGILPSCEGLGATECRPDLCEHYVAHYKSRVARRAIACVKEGASSACVTCGPTALAEACDDPSAAETCLRVDRFCADAGRPDAAGSLETCTARLSGMTFGGRVSFVNCVTESSCGSSGFQFDDCAR